MQHACHICAPRALPFVTQVANKPEFYWIFLKILEIPCVSATLAALANQKLGPIVILISCANGVASDCTVGSSGTHTMRRAGTGVL
jgi:hypothetical protein